MSILGFNEWLPDQATLENPGANEAKNVIPRTLASYGPVQALQEVGNALTAYCQGAGSYRGIAGTVFVTAGDATKLYKYTSGAWSDVSRLAGGAYTTLAEDQWFFAQFGDYVVAVNGIDAPQVFQIGFSANYAALGGSPPVARFACAVRDQLVIGRIAAAKNRVKWSGLNDITGWTIGTNLSDEQDLPSGGQIMGLIGGEFGTVFCESSIYRMRFSGYPLIFQFDRISEDRGCCAENSLAVFEQTTFGLDWDGFFALKGGQEFATIGDQKIDRFFWNDVNQSFLNRVVGTVDPLNKLYIVAYPSTSSTLGTPDSLLFYNWTIGRWSRAKIDLDTLFQALTNEGYNWDNVDSVITNTDATSFSVDTSLFIGSGKAKLGAFSTNKKLATFEGANLEAILGTSEVQLVDGFRSQVSELWPYFDGGTLSASMGTRNLPNEAVTWSSFVSQNTVGFVPFESDARFHQVQVKVAAGSTWTHGQGVRPKLQKSGTY